MYSVGSDKSFGILRLASATVSPHVASEAVSVNPTEAGNLASPGRSKDSGQVMVEAASPVFHDLRDVNLFLLNVY